MLSYRRYSAPSNYTLPAAGSKVIFFGDSISDNNYRHWANKLMDRYGWIGVNQPYLANGNFETNTTGMNAELNCAVTQSSTLAATLSPVTSTHSAQITASGAGNMWANFGASGAFTNFMELGYTYTFAAWVRCGATVTPANVFLQFNSTGNTVASINSAALSATTVFQHLSVTLALVNGTDAYLRAVCLSAPSGAGIQVDGAELRRVSSGQASNTNAVYEDWATRGAISGSNLQSNDATASNGVSTFAARVTAYMPVDLLVVEYGMNDLYYINGSPTPTTLATWTTAVTSILTSYAALSPKPKLLWLGITNSQDTLTLPAWAVSQDDAVRQLDAITAPLVTAAGGLFVPMRQQMDNRLVDVGGGQPRHPTRPEGENAIYERIVRFLEMGF